MSSGAVPLSALATSRRWQHNFLKVLPAVQTHAKVYFRRLRPGARAEATAEAVARACVTYRKLVQQKKLGQVYVGNIATFAVKAVNSGRRVGGHQNRKDVLSPTAQKTNGIAVASLSPWSTSDNTWRDLLLESRRVSPADQACFNLDFQDWLRAWPQRHRQIITALAAGHRAKAVARKFGVTEGRMSQLRDRYQRSWEQFQGAETEAKAA